MPQPRIFDTLHPFRPRLLGAMAAWSRMDKGRQEQARAALERLDRPGISSDLSETLGRLRRASLANE